MVSLSSVARNRGPRPLYRSTERNVVACNKLHAVPCTRLHFPSLSRFCTPMVTAVYHQKSPYIEPPCIGPPSVFWGFFHGDFLVSHFFLQLSIFRVPSPFFIFRVHFPQSISTFHITFSILHFHVPYSNYTSHGPFSSCILFRVLVFLCRVVPSCCRFPCSFSLS